MRLPQYTPAPANLLESRFFGSATGFSMQISETPLQADAA